MDVIVPKQITAGAVMRASSGSYYNNNGIIVSAANDIGRLNYDPNNLSAFPNILLEQYSKNFIANTENPALGTGTYALSNATLKPNIGIAPDGRLEMNKICEGLASIGAADHSLKVTPTALDVTQTTVFSFYASAGEISQVMVTIGPTTSSPINWIFDLSAGTAVANSAASSTCGIVKIRSGLYRCYVNFTPTPGGNSSLIASNNSMNVSTIKGGTNIYTGDNTSGFYAWGFQMEAGSVPSSYVPSVITETAGAAGTSTYINSLGQVVNSTSSTNRQSYSPTNLSLGPKYLGEGDSANYVANSNDITGSPWTASTGATRTANTTLSPDGTTNADTVADTSTTVLAQITNSVAVNVGTNFVVASIFIKKTTGATTFPGLYVNSASSGNQFSAITINTNTGVAVAATSGVPVASTGESVSPPNYINVTDYITYWRVAVSIYSALPFAGGQTIQLTVFPSVNTDASATWTVGTTGSCIVWGAQLEINSSGSETSYIPNTSTTLNSRTRVTITNVSGVRQPDIPSYGLLATNIPENDFPVWNSATTYGIETGTGANTVIYQHRIYKSLRARNTNFNPATDTTVPAYWLNTGPTNAYGMFDGQVGTLTVNNSGDIIVEMNIGGTTAVAFNQLSADSVNVQLINSGTVVYNKTVDTTGGTTGVAVTDVVLNDLPSMPTALLAVTIHAASGIVSCGNFVAGTVHYLGSTETAPTIGINDYSIKTIDAFGNPTLTIRNYSKRMDVKTMIIDQTQVDVVARLLANVRATPCLWNANTTISNRTVNTFTSMIVYGYYNDWNIVPDVPSNNILSIQIEGLI